MKNYQRPTYFRYLADLNDGTDHILEEGCEGVFTNFDKDYAPWVISLVKKIDKSYGRIGVLDFNDLIQIANQCFIKTWDKIDWTRVEKEPIDKRQFVVWAYLKKTIRLSVKKEIRNLKDGIRTPLYLYENSMIDGFLTSIFPNLFEGQMASRDTTRFEQEVLSDFLEMTMDKYLDRTFKGKRSRGIERNVISMYYGLDGIEKRSLKEIADCYKVSEGHVKNINSEAINKLKDEELSDWMEESFKECVAAFLISEEIPTDSDAYDYYEKILKNRLTLEEEIGN